MARSMIVFSVLAGSVLATCMVKHIPLANIYGTSSAIITAGGLFAVGLKIGFGSLFDLFRGRGEQDNLKLAMISLAMTAGIGVTLGMMVLMQNLSNNDRYGPAISASVIAVIYSLFLGGFLSIVNSGESEKKDSLTVRRSDAVSLSASAAVKEEDHETHAA